LRSLRSHRYCPRGDQEDTAEWSTAEVTAYNLCVQQLVVFYDISHALAGYPGEGRVEAFNPDPRIVCCADPNVPSTCATEEKVDAEKFCMYMLEEETGTFKYDKPYNVSYKITDTLALLDSESKNAEYAKGERSSGAAKQRSSEQRSER
jgi:hypothetical protein